MNAIAVANKIAKANANVMVFTLGIPYSGKSTVANSLFPNFVTVDADIIKESLNNYNPAQADLFHHQSMMLWEASVDAAILKGNGQFVIASTGADGFRLARQMRQAKDAGFKVVLLSVKCSVATALTRQAGRKRIVSAAMIKEKAQLIGSAYNGAKNIADEIIKVDNDLNSAPAQVSAPSVTAWIPQTVTKQVQLTAGA